MKIHVPGLGTTYVDEDPPQVEAAKPANFPTIAEAMALANQRQVLNFETVEKPLIDHEAEAAAKAKAEAESVARAAEQSQALEAAANAASSDELLK